MEGRGRGLRDKRKQNSAKKNRHQKLGALHALAMSTFMCLVQSQRGIERLGPNWPYDWQPQRFVANPLRFMIDQATPHCAAWCGESWRTRESKHGVTTTPQYSPCKLDVSHRIAAEAQQQQCHPSEQRVRQVLWIGMRVPRACTQG